MCLMHTRFHEILAELLHGSRDARESFFSSASLEDDFRGHGIRCLDRH